MAQKNNENSHLEIKQRHGDDIKKKPTTTSTASLTRAKKKQQEIRKFGGRMTTSKNGKEASQITEECRR